MRSGHRCFDIVDEVRFRDGGEGACDEGRVATEVGSSVRDGEQGGKEELNEEWILSW